jgi:hypothetical protein
LLPADYAALIQQLSSNPAKFAIPEERKLYREAAKLLISIKQLDKQLEELKEQERLEPIFEQMNLNNSTKGRPQQLSTRRMMMLEKSRVVQAQIHLAFDDYLKATPYYLVSSTSWQTYAATKLRNPLDFEYADSIAALEPQFVAYEKFLQDIQGRASALAQAISQSVTTTSTSQIISCINERMQLLQAARAAADVQSWYARHKSPTTTSIYELSQCKQPLVVKSDCGRYEVGVYGPGVPTSGGCRSLGTTAWNALNLSAHLTEPLPTIATPSSEQLSSWRVQGDCLLDRAFSHKIGRDLQGGEEEFLMRLQKLEPASLKTVPNDHWSVMHTKFVLLEWESMMNDIIPPGCATTASAAATERDDPDDAL